MTSAQSPRVAVLGLDGLPWSLAQRMMEDGIVPNLASLARESAAGPLDSVAPTVSSVAWTSFNTGVQPGKHGLYGFVKRAPGSWDIGICDTGDIARPMMAEAVSQSGGAAFMMNVPVSTPPREIDGVMVGCFLSSDLDRAVTPPAEAETLRSLNYRIDTDPMLARRDKAAMLEDIRATVTARIDAALHYIKQRRWDFFHVHVMATDRLNHFLLAQALNGGELGEAFFDCYRFIDGQVGRLLAALGDAPLVVLSDHGFEPIEREVQLSQWMVSAGWTAPAEGGAKHPLDVCPARTRAYHVIPGQFFLNLEGREPQGVVPLEEYAAVRQELKSDLLALTDPATGEAVIDRVWMREEIFWGEGQDGPDGAMTSEAVATAGGAFGRAPDLVAEPASGYDLKMGLGAQEVYVTTQLEGMHTRRDATLMTRGVDIPQAPRPWIAGLAAPVLGAIGVEAHGLDGVAANPCDRN